jgi:hypothetical protein
MPTALTKKIELNRLLSIECHVPYTISVRAALREDELSGTGPRPRTGVIQWDGTLAINLRASTIATDFMDLVK